jgi:hypothetical protein
MNQQNNLTISDAGGLILGAGLVKLGQDVNLGLILVAVGTLLKILVAVLNKEGIAVQTPIG